MSNIQKIKTAVFPGSFDPITLGHVDIVRRGLLLFDKVIIAVGSNTSKKNLFTAEQRLEMVKNTFRGEPKVECKTFTGLTVDLCHKEKADYILRGLRNGLDFEYEESIAAMNRKLAGDIETVLLFSSTGEALISSTIVREIIINKGDVSRFVPDDALPVIEKVK